MTWKLFTDDNGDEWVLGPESHKYYIGNLESTCKICYEHARLFIHAEEMHEALKAAEKTSKAKEHLDLLDREHQGPRAIQAHREYTDALGDSYRMRKEVLVKMEEAPWEKEAECTK